MSVAWGSPVALSATVLVRPLSQRPRGSATPYPAGKVETVMAVSFCFPNILAGGALAVETATSVLADIFLMFLAAKIAGELFERLRQPAVIGELLVGVILGPYALGWIGVPTAGMIAELHGEQIAAEAMHSIMEVLAELGVIVLLFLVGLETRLSDILTVGVRAGLVAVAGVVVPFIL